MKRVGTFAAIAFGSAAVLAAQGTPGQTPQPQPGRSGGSTDTRPAQSSQSGTVTLTGCLQRAGGASSGAAGGAGSSSASGASSQSAASYILADATMGKAPSAGGSSAGAAGTSGSSASGAAGTSGSSAAGRSGSTYMLDGSASEFSSHVNKRVEVTGTMASGSSSGAGSSGAGTPGAGTPGATASSAGASAGGQHFKVTSVREVGGDCSPSASSPR